MGVSNFEVFVQMLVKKKEHRDEVELLWGMEPDSLNPKPGLHTIALFDALGAGKVKALLVLCINPAQSLPNVNKYREGMARKVNVYLKSGI